MYACILLKCYVEFKSMYVVYICMYLYVCTVHVCMYLEFKCMHACMYVEFKCMCVWLCMYLQFKCIYPCMYVERERISLEKLYLNFVQPQTIWNSGSL